MIFCGLEQVLQYPRPLVGVITIFKNLTPNDLGKIDLKKARPGNGGESSEYQNRHVKGHFTPNFPALHFFPFKHSFESNTIPLNREKREKGQNNGE